MSTSRQTSVDRGDRNSEYANLIAFISPRDTGYGRNTSSADQEREKATKAIYLTQKTSIKIALLVDAIAKKQRPILRKWTGRVKLDADALSFLEYLQSMRLEEDVWSKVCMSSDNEEDRLDFAKYPEVIQAIVEARRNLLRIDRNIRLDILQPLKDNLVNGTRPDYTALHKRTEVLGKEAVNVSREICSQLASVTSETGDPAKIGNGQGTSERSSQFVIPAKLQGLSEAQLLQAISHF